MRKMKQIESELKDDAYDSSDTINLAGGKAWTMSNTDRVIQILHTGTLEDAYYANQKTLAKEAVAVLKAAPVDVLQKWIPIGRNKGFMRTAPTIALAILFEKDTVAAREIFNEVIRTGNDLSAFIDTIRARGRGFGRGIKKAINNWLKEQLSEFYAIKYGNDVTQGIRIARPAKRDIGEQASLVADYLMAKEKGFTEFIQRNSLTESYPAGSHLMDWLVDNQLFKAEAFEKLKVYGTLISQGELKLEDARADIKEQIRKGRLDYSVVTSAIKPDADLWKSMAKEMGVFALLRHLKTFERHDLHNDKEFVEFLFDGKTVEVEPEDGFDKRYTEKVDGRISAKNLEKAKVFPFRVYQAWMAVTSDVFKNRLADVMDAYIPNADFTGWGRVAIAPDTSGSMKSDLGRFDYIRSRSYGRKAPRSTMRYVDIACMFAGVLYKGCEGSKVLPFDTQLYPEIVPSAESKIIDIINPIIGCGGGGTYMEMPMQWMLGQRVDNRSGYYGRRSRYSGYAKTPTADGKVREFDTVIYITDGEEWGQGWLNYWIQYKKKVPKAKAILLRLDTYSSQPFDPATADKYDIIQVFGWSNNVFDYINYKLNPPAR